MLVFVGDSSLICLKLLVISLKVSILINVMFNFNFGFRACIYRVLVF
jgi:hypothetical protein